MPKSKKRTETVEKPKTPLEWSVERLRLDCDITNARLDQGEGIDGLYAALHPLTKAIQELGNLIVLATREK